MPLFSPVGGGGIGKATVTGTTGSPNIDTTSRPGKTIYKFTGSGSITIGAPGTAEILVVGGGGCGGGGYGGGGAGGYVYDTSAMLPSGTLTITVGAGASASYNSNYYFSTQNSNPSRIGKLYVALGGGLGGITTNAGLKGSTGGSGGGACATNGYTNESISGSVGLINQGNAGGGYNYGAPYSCGGGGGGAGGSGNANSGYDGGNGGSGASNSITGSSVTYAGGGGGGGGSGGSGGSGGGGAGSSTNGTSGTANTGGGGGGAGNGYTPGSGGSGVVIVVVG